MILFLHLSPILFGRSAVPIYVRRSPRSRDRANQTKPNVRPNRMFVRTEGSAEICRICRTCSAKNRTIVRPNRTIGRIEQVWFGSAEIGFGRSLPRRRRSTRQSNRQIGSQADSQKRAKPGLWFFFQSLIIIYVHKLNVMQIILEVTLHGQLSGFRLSTSSPRSTFQMSLKIGQQILILIVCRTRMTCFKEEN